MNKYNRVLLKLSGEALADKSNSSILDAKKLQEISTCIKSMVNRGVQVCVVIGAGNIWRGNLASSIGIERTQADYMGMLGTIINCMALQSCLETLDIESRVMNSIDAKEVGEPYIRRRAVRHLEKNRVVIFGGGTGNPYFTTDTAAALRANEVGCEAILMAKNGADGVYSDDPRVNEDAILYKELTFKDLVVKNLKVMDTTACSLCMESNIEIRVFNMNEVSNVEKILNGEPVGTTIRKEI